MERGHCLVSQQLREKTINGSIIVPEKNLSLNSEGRFSDEKLEQRVQPSSFEPTLGKNVFILDADERGVLRPQAGTSIYRNLLQLPMRQRQSIDISKGFEIKKGFSYLFPLNEKVILEEDEFVKSSPKSSCGRLFLNSRLLTDYNPSFDEIHSHYKTLSPLDLWLLVQPFEFNVIVYPGVSLNQIRFFKGADYMLNDSEIMEEFRKNPFLFTLEDGKLTPINVVLSEGLHIRLDLKAKNTKGVFGLRARHNPMPIDITKKEYYDAESFFEPLKSDDETFTIKRGEHYLLASKEFFDVPLHANIELQSHSHIGLSGPLHFAGFFDNRFTGNGVLEVKSEEIADMKLEDGMPISKLRVYRTEIPDKLYGTSIGSNYAGQIGPRTSKNFKPFDFDYAAKNYQKLKKIVLVQDRKIIEKLRYTQEGFEFIDKDKITELENIVNEGLWHSRYDCEKDESVLQIIPYVLVFGPDGKVFSYVRVDKIEEYGEERLFNKHSIGLGGHILKTDAPDFLKNCIRRELEKEEVEFTGNYYEPKLVGTILVNAKPVDRVHFGLVYVMHTDGEVKAKESSIVLGGMETIGELFRHKGFSEMYETESWSRILIPHLPRIYYL